MQKKLSWAVAAWMLPQLSMAAGVHQHGVAQLDVVLEPPALTLALHSPLANFIGFEYQPVTAAEQASWEQLQGRCGKLRCGWCCRTPRDAV